MLADVYDDYEEISCLGGGGYSDVYLMEKFDEPGLQYAVKVMQQVCTHMLLGSMHRLTTILMLQKTDLANEDELKKVASQ